jgi:ribA/ribD-fused uncharacterized protein
MQMPEERAYNRDDCIVFRKTNERFGGLSNMAAGYVLHVNGVLIGTVEALYQACRFSHRPDIQSLILAEKSPMTAKMRGKPYRSISREDWEEVKVSVMRWCLRIKLHQHRSKFAHLLQDTDAKQIVEESRRDDYWGAKPLDREILVGRNVLGRLLMELRDLYVTAPGSKHLPLDPPRVANFLLLGRPIDPESLADEQPVDIALQL